MYKLKAKVLISKKPTCNCGGFYHPGEVFNEDNEQKVKRYIAKGWVEVLEAPIYITVDGEQNKVADYVAPSKEAIQGNAHLLDGDKEEKKSSDTKELKAVRKTKNK